MQSALNTTAANQNVTNGSSFSLTGGSLLTISNNNGYGLNLTAAQTLSGSLNLASASWIDADPGTTLNLSGRISGANALTFANSGDTLQLMSGGLQLHNAGDVTVGSAPGNGFITANDPVGFGTTITSGASASGLVPLCLHVANNNLTMNASIVDDPGVGPVRLVYTTYNGGTLTLNSTNTYTGGTVVDGWATGATGSMVVTASGTLSAGGVTLNQDRLTVNAGGTIAT